MSTTYISDGYTARGYIREARGQHGSLRFTYRPVLAKNRSAILKLVRETDSAQEQEGILAQTIAKHVESWDLKDEHGNALPVELATAERLQPTVFSRCFRIIIGDLPSDEDAEQESQEVEATVEEKLARALEDKPPVPSEQEQEGN